MNIILYIIIEIFFDKYKCIFFFICITNTAKFIVFVFLENFICYIQQVWLISLLSQYETIWNSGIDFV